MDDSSFESKNIESNSGNNLKSDEEELINRIEEISHTEVADLNMDARNYKISKEI